MSNLFCFEEHAAFSKYLLMLGAVACIHYELNHVSLMHTLSGGHYYRVCVLLAGKLRLREAK
jgi:hypothetical protein